MKMHPFACTTEDAGTLTLIQSALGFCLIKSVFSAEEMRCFETAVAAHHKAYDGRVPDLMSCDGLSSLLLDDRILAIARAALGPQLLYYGLSNVNYEPDIGPLTTRPYAALHADAMGRPDNLYGDVNVGDADYPAIRFAVYFRDYADHSGGLRVLPGSHRLALTRQPISNGETTLVMTETSRSAPWLWADDGTPVTTGHVFNVPSEPGDVVIWNLRLMHGGGARRPIQTPNAILPVATDAALQHAPFEAIAPIAGPRNALFFDYGRAAPELDLYIKARALDEKIVASTYKAAQYDREDIQADLAEKNIACRMDGLLVATCLALNEAAEESERTRLKERLATLIGHHREESPHMSLLPESIENLDTVAAHVTARVADAKRMKGA